MKKIVVVYKNEKFKSNAVDWLSEKGLEMPASEDYCVMYTGSGCLEIIDILSMESVMNISICQLIECNELIIFGSFSEKDLKDILFNIKIIEDTKTGEE